MKLNRRRLLQAAAGSALEARAQTTPAQETDPTKAAHDANQRNAETLARFELPMSTEPAFEFRP
ncbi:MAG: hypothetical protein ABSB15_26220 [Bryobacteraceae bacterium]|jgi:hypothetical protein